MPSYKIADYAIGLPASTSKGLQSILLSQQRKYRLVSPVLNESWEVGQSADTVILIGCDPVIQCMMQVFLDEFHCKGIFLQNEPSGLHRNGRVELRRIKPHKIKAVVLRPFLVRLSPLMNKSSSIPDTHINKRRDGRVKDVRSVP